MDKNGTLSEKMYEELFRGNREVFEYLAYSYVGNWEEARDIVSHCFTKLWERRNTIIPETVAGYMFTTVRNACLDYRKSAKGREQSESLIGKERDLYDYYNAVIEQTDLSELYVDDIIEISRKTLESLPDERREAFLRNRIDGLTYEQIADAMGISRRKVNRDIYSALKELRISLKDYLSIIIIITLLEQLQ